jgi:hypothetical protein
MVSRLYGFIIMGMDECWEGERYNIFCQGADHRGGINLCEANVGRLALAHSLNREVYVRRARRVVQLAHKFIPTTLSEETKWPVVSSQTRCSSHSAQGMVSTEHSTVEWLVRM